MKLYNRSGRALIIDIKHVVEGGRFGEHDNKQDRKYFDPQSNMEVTDEYGAKLMKMYPKELMQTDKKSARKEVAPVKKDKKKKR